ncbi:putative enzyme related to lactoylglutathione lyase [Litorimonas taeanensis]|uniref:Putative enzyme related to lactoylglutathione lyase n=1 Tax=Litorimonas taeanensis TaxID=568099 RepID=A0A420WJY6_9PROT|nr:VOC family protein [Litorimonas taeanensis]RKQ71242.1 putative enzyme related to lactoylglutathione lyase [Litorimonas taeanensis]
MAKILGLGGIFIRCRDVKAYRNWWSEVMGLDMSDWGTFEWEDIKTSRSMFSPFSDDSDYFSPSEHRVMINLQVEDVHELIERARSGGADIIGEIDVNEYGTFGWFIDPEGYKIELWEAPSAPSK